MCHSKSGPRTTRVAFSMCPTYMPGNGLRESRFCLNSPAVTRPLSEARVIPYIRTVYIRTALGLVVLRASTFHIKSPPDGLGHWALHTPGPLHLAGPRGSPKGIWRGQRIVAIGEAIR